MVAVLLSGVDYAQTFGWAAEGPGNLYQVRFEVPLFLGGAITRTQCCLLLSSVSGFSLCGNPCSRYT